MTTNEKRRQKWQRIFGTDTLPVKSPSPRWQVMGGPGEQVTFAYDLDAERLHWMARQRFATYATLRAGHTITAANVDGWPIKALGCQLVENETAENSTKRKRPFSFLNNQGHRPAHLSFA